MNKEELLFRINADLPRNVDWKAGAENYVAEVFRRAGREATDRFSLTKPLAEIGLAAFPAAFFEAMHYLRNFVDLIGLLQLPPRSRIMDVACGGGWLSHYCARLGYHTFGFDISSDFVELAKRRFREDPYLNISDAELDRIFVVHDIERLALPDDLDGTFEAVVLESCLHHFYNPIDALSHLTPTLKPNGVVVLIEGENRNGAIRDEWMQVMRDYKTLERPYPRELLVKAMEMAGLPEVEFVAPINGWISPNDPRAYNLSAAHQAASDAMNLGIAAKNKDALRRIFPFR